MWSELIKAEPRLLALYERAKAVRDEETKEFFCANSIWYQQFKPELVELVGDARAGDPILGTSRAYEIAYDMIYRALPDCRACGESDLK